MILYWDEFKEYDEHYASLLSKLNLNEKYIHEMDIEDIQQYLGMYGRGGFNYRKTALTKYLRWLHDEYNVDTTEIHYKLKNINSVVYEDVYFYSFDEMFTTISDAIEQGCIISEANGTLSDFDGLKVFFLLQWYGVTAKEFISIHLDNVNGKKIYIPSTNRVILVDEKTADVIKEYKNKQGVDYSNRKRDDIKYYKQNTLYRSTRDVEINEKTINNVRGRFNKYYQDIRLTKNNILDSGQYYRLLEVEKKLGRDVTGADADIIRQTFLCGTKSVYPILSKYKTYKEKRDEWLSRK